ncbi:hypothetical protein BX600DRAFT_431693 [Xylariales sp. PMI_506]|nr:hypothetical protein BX600DRAFT_431693 [Xylariales sp. PMI_506]
MRLNLPFSSRPASVARLQTVTQIQTTLEIPCPRTVLTRDTWWYIPDGTHKGLIWLQHGFARGGAHLTDLARRFSAEGFIVLTPSIPSANIFGYTLENLGNNHIFLSRIAALIGDIANAEGRVATSFAKATTAAGQPGLALPSQLVLAGHSAGGEAIAFIANAIRNHHPQTFGNLRGVILFDPVPSFFGDNLGTGISGLDSTDLRILTISGRRDSSNKQGKGTDLVQSMLHRPFVGARLVTGRHTDTEGASTDWIATTACGVPLPENVEILQKLAVSWAKDFFAGTTTEDQYPGGSYFESLVAAGRVKTLEGLSGFA